MACTQLPTLHVYILTNNIIITVTRWVFFSICSLKWINFWNLDIWNCFWFWFYLPFGLQSESDVWFTQTKKKMSLIRFNVHSDYSSNKYLTTNSCIICIILQIIAWICLYTMTHWHTSAAFESKYTAEIACAQLKQSGFVVSVE